MHLLALRTISAAKVTWPDPLLLCYLARPVVLQRRAGSWASAAVVGFSDTFIDCNKES